MKHLTTRSLAVMRRLFASWVLLAGCRSSQPEAAAPAPSQTPRSAPAEGSVPAEPVMPTPPALPRAALPVPVVAPVAPRLVVEFIMSESIGGDGVIESVEIDPVLRSLTPAMLSCGERASNETPRYLGVLEARFTLGGSGRASRVNATNRAQRSTVPACAASALRRASFPPARGGSAELLIAYRFSLR